MYILKCSDESYYTGYTIDIEKRVNAHNRLRASAYTWSKRPVTLIYSETCRNRSDAMKREREIKKMKREEKEKLSARGLKITAPLR